MIGFPKPEKTKKKRSYIRRVGKIGRINIEANKELKQKYSDLHQLPPCEIGKIGLCWHVTHGFAHRHSRVDYRQYPEMLSSINQTLKACNPCHNWMDAHKAEREALFLIKRGPDLLDK